MRLKSCQNWAPDRSLPSCNRGLETSYATIKTHSFCPHFLLDRPSSWYSGLCGKHLKLTNGRLLLQVSRWYNRQARMGWILDILIALIKPCKWRSRSTSFTTACLICTKTSNLTSRCSSNQKNGNNNGKRLLQCWFTFWVSKTCMSQSTMIFRASLRKRYKISTSNRFCWTNAFRRRHFWTGNCKREQLTSRPISSSRMSFCKILKATRAKSTTRKQKLTPSSSKNSIW